MRFYALLNLVAITSITMVMAAPIDVVARDPSPEAVAQSSYASYGTYAPPKGGYGYALSFIFYLSVGNF